MCAADLTHSSRGAHAFLNSGAAGHQRRVGNAPLQTGGHIELRIGQRTVWLPIATTVLLSFVAMLIGHLI